MSEFEKPGYWAVIPAGVRYNEQIPPNAKLLYAEISSLTQEDGYCWATNEYFQKVFGFSERSVQRLIRVLERQALSGSKTETAKSERSTRASILSMVKTATVPKMAPLNPDKIVTVTPTKLSPLTKNTLLIRTI